MSVIKIGMLVFDRLTQLDLTAPLEVFSRYPHVKLHIISHSLEPVQTESGFRFLPDTTFENCPSKLEVIFIPGGPGIIDVMKDDRYMKFIRSTADASYITSVCTGSILLAAAGLLTGYKATTHWLSIDLLKRFGVDTIHERVVIDRNRITGSGVTSGIDFALTLAAVLFSEEVAKEIQLLIEYDPQPPFRSGSPTVADENLVAKVKMQKTHQQLLRLNEINKFLDKH